MTPPLLTTLRPLALAATLLASPVGQAQTTQTARAPTAAAPVAAPTAAPTATSAVGTTAPRAAPLRVARASPVPLTEPADAVAGPTEDVVLGLGEILMLPVKGKVRRIAVGSGTQVSATAVDNQLMLIGEQLGVTSLMFWTEREVRSYRVRVLPADFIATRRLIDSVLQGSGTVTAEQYGPKLVISGVAQRQQIEQLNTLLKDQPNVVLNLRSDATTPVVRSVLFRLHFIEVAKSLLEKIGIQWAKEMNGPAFAAQGVAINDGIYRNLPQSREGDNLLSGTPPFVTRNARQSGIFFGLASAIASRINLGVSDGDARILASPELTARSGGKARLQVGGEVPIPLAGAFGTTTVEFKPYGIILSIEPVIDSNGVINAKLSTELSQIDTSVTVAGIPGFLTRSTSTEISVKPGEMVALSGLVNHELSSAIDKVPGLGNVPIFGRLFRSDDFRNKKTDLVVLLEPEIVTPGDGMAGELRARGQQNTTEFVDKVNKLAEPPAGKAPTQQDVRSFRDAYGP